MGLRGAQRAVWVSLTRSGRCKFESIRWVLHHRMRKGVRLQRVLGTEYHVSCV